MFFRLFGEKVRKKYEKKEKCRIKFGEIAFMKRLLLDIVEIG